MWKSEDFAPKENSMLRFLSFLFGSYFAMASAVCAAEQRSIRVGYLLDLSGKGAFMGQQSQAGAVLAQRELAREGVRLELYFEDNRTEGKAGATGAQRLIQVDSVDVLLCDLTPPCVAASPIARTNSRLFLYQAPADSIRQTNPYAFRNFLDYQAGCRAIAQYWAGRGMKKIAHLKVNAEFGELCLRGASETGLQQEIVEYDAGTDMRSIITRLKPLAVEAILQTGYEGDYIGRLRAASDLGLSVPSGLPQPLVTDAVIRAVPAGVLNGSVVFGFPAVGAEFERKLREEKLFRTPVAIESAAIAYTFVRQAVAAVQACSPADLTCQVRSIASSRLGELGFQGWEERSARYPMKIRTFRDGKFSEIEGANKQRVGGDKSKGR